jgi:histidinol-phosphatase (PHP family)
LQPVDGHAHSEWSWDAPDGSMTASCARAIELGLPAVAFTEHADLTAWRLPREAIPLLPLHFRERLSANGRLTPPDLDVPGYQASLLACRERFPGLRILSGVELSEPHWHPGRVADLLAQCEFDRVLGAVHSIDVSGEPVLVDVLDLWWPSEDILRGYLAEVLRMVQTSDAFEVLAHIDYPVRYWQAARPFDPAPFESQLRMVLRALAAGERVLEVNTRIPPHPMLVRWWHEAGGAAVSFGGDSHEPAALGRRFPEAAEMVRCNGFRPGRAPHHFWVRQ